MNRETTAIRLLFDSPRVSELGREPAPPKPAYSRPLPRGIEASAPCYSCGGAGRAKRRKATSTAYRAKQRRAGTPLRPCKACGAKGYEPLDARPGTPQRVTTADFGSAVIGAQPPAAYELDLAELGPLELRRRRAIRFVSARSRHVAEVWFAPRSAAQERAEAARPLAALWPLTRWGKRAHILERQGAPAYAVDALLRQADREALALLAEAEEQAKNACFIAGLRLPERAFEASGTVTALPRRGASEVNDAA